MVRPLCFLLVALAACALTAPAVAQTVPVVVSAYSNTPVGVSGGNLQTMAVYEAKAAQTAANARFYSRSAAFTKQTLGGGLRSRLALGPNLVLTAAVVGAGWAINEITKQVTIPTSGTYTPLPLGVTSWCNPYWGSCGYASAYDALTAGVPTYERGATNWGNPGTWGGYTGGYMRMNLLWNDYRCPGGGYCPGPGYRYAYPAGSGADYQNVINSPTQPPNIMPLAPATPVTDEQLGQLVLDNPQTWPEVLNNPNGSPRVLTPMPQQMTDVQTQYRIDTGLTPLPSGSAEPIPAPTTAPSTYPLPATEPVPTGSVAPPPAPLAFPVFCTWASKVCEFFDWMKTDPPSNTTYLGPLDPPTVDLGSTAVEWDSGLGDGTCPAPATVTVLSQTHEMSFQSVCDLAVGGRIFVLISATLGAGLMLLRVFA